MAGKNTSVYGIYAFRTTGKTQLTGCLHRAFATKTFRCCCKIMWERKILLTKGDQGAGRHHCWRSNGWCDRRDVGSSGGHRRVSDSRGRILNRSRPHHGNPGPASDLAASWAVLSAHLSAWAFPSMRRNATRVA